MCGRKKFARLASVKALQESQQALDNPKLVGIVLPEASDSDRTNHEGQYFTPSKGQ